MSEGIREIYNEGRVVGLSAYELYVRKQIEEDPTVTPPSEKAWLASMFGNGAAMILKINSGTQPGVHDFNLPTNSVLCGSNNILATVFNGECTWSDTPTASATGDTGYWAENIASYGGLISNNSEAYPSGTDIPYSDSLFDADNDRKNIVNFCNIAEGICIQQGTWSRNTATDAPYMDLTDPDFSQSGIIRLYIKKPLTTDVKILFTGFLDSGFVKSLAGIEGSTNPEANGWENGEFLGPAIYPWASKIIMIYPNIANLYGEDYVRSLPYGTLESTEIGSYSFAGQDTDVEVSSVIDFNTTDPNTYYQVNSAKYGNSVIPVNVDPLSTPKDGVNVLSVFEPGMTADKANEAYALEDPNSRFFPPALYASKITSSGIQNMVPVDTAAPGTTKTFDTAEEAFNYVKQLPNNYAMYYDSTSGILQLFDKSATSTSDGRGINTNLSVERINTSDSRAVKGVISSNNVTVKTVALSDDSGTEHPTTGSAGAIGIDLPSGTSTAGTGFSWSNLLDALANNKVIDVLGNQLKVLRDNLPNLTLTGVIRAVKGIFTTSVGSPKVVIGDPDSTTANAEVSYDNNNQQVICNKGIKVDGTITDNSGYSMNDYILRRVVTGTLSAGATTIRIPASGTDSMFTNTANSCYKIFTSKWGVNPLTVTPSNGYVTLTFRAQTSAITVGAMCFDRKS